MVHMWRINLGDPQYPYVATLRSRHKFQCNLRIPNTCIVNSSYDSKGSSKLLSFVGSLLCVSDDEFSHMKLEKITIYHL